MKKMIVIDRCFDTDNNVKVCPYINVNHSGDSKWAHICEKWRKQVKDEELNIIPLWCKLKDYVSSN